MSKTTPARARRLLATIVSAALVLAGSVALPAIAAAPAAAAERTFAVVGSFQEELGCAEDWQADCDITDLAPTDTEGVYAAEFTVPAGTYAYKVAVNDAWDEAYGPNGGSRRHPSDDRGTSTLRFLFDDNLKRGRTRGPLGPRGLHRRRRDARRGTRPPAGQRGAVLLRDDRPVRQRRPVERHGGDRRRPSGARLRPHRQGLLQRRRHRGSPREPRLHQGSRHDGHLADPELQEPAGAGHRGERLRGVPRLLDHRLHADRPPPRHERRARGVHRRSPRRGHQGLLRHHHEPHRRPDRLRRGSVLVHRQGHEPLHRRRRHRDRPRRVRRWRPRVPGDGSRDVVPVHARRDRRDARFRPG